MTDYQLWNNLKEGSKKALQEIYEREADYMYSYGRRFSNDEHTVLDAIQELFIEIWEKRETIGMTDKIRPYLLTSIRRKIIKSAKSSMRMVSDGEENNIMFRSEEGVESVIIEDETQKENKKRLQLGMQKLSDRQREAIHLKYLQERTYEEIGEIMDINYQSVRNLISQGIKKMREYVNSS